MNYSRESQCHAEGGATKGGVSKCEQTQANADKRGQTQANAEAKRKQTQASASKRGQTQRNAYTPLYCGFYDPLCNPLRIETFLTGKMALCKKTEIFPVNFALVTAKVDAETPLENGQILGDLLCQ